MRGVRREGVRGDTFLLALQVFRDLTLGSLTAVDAGQPPPPNSVPQDLTGARVWFTCKNSYVDADLQAVSELDNQALGGVTVTNALTGNLLVQMPPLATRALPDAPVDLVYDVQVKTAAGLLQTVDSGTLVITPDVTRAIA